MTLLIRLFHKTFRAGEYARAAELARDIASLSASPDVRQRWEQTARSIEERTQ